MYGVILNVDVENKENQIQSQQPRDELIQMRMHGDPNGTYPANKFFYFAYVRKW